MPAIRCNHCGYEHSQINWKADFRPGALCPSCGQGQMVVFKEESFFEKIGPGGNMIAGALGVLGIQKIFGKKEKR